MWQSVLVVVGQMLGDLKALFCLFIMIAFCFGGCVVNYMVFVCFSDLLVNHVVQLYLPNLVNLCV